MKLTSVLVVAVAALATTGCNKLFPIPLNNINYHNSALPPTLTILVGGQSNAFNMVYYAQQTLVAEIHKRSPGTVVTVLNCAVFSTSVSDWGIGSKNYTGCVTVAAGRHIDVIFWNQGENEAEGVDPWQTWAGQTALIIQGLRRDTGNMQAPLVYARLGNFVNDSTWPYWDEMRDEQTRAGFSNAYMVNLDNVSGAHPGSLHYDTMGYDEIAARFVQTYWGAL